MHAGYVSILELSFVKLARPLSLKLDPDKTRRLGVGEGMGLPSVSVVGTARGVGERGHGFVGLTLIVWTRGCGWGMSPSRDCVGVSE